jgi:hypothetical protein
MKRHKCSINNARPIETDRLRCDNSFCDQVTVAETCEYTQYQCGLYRCSYGHNKDGVAGVWKINARGILRRSGPVDFLSSIEWVESDSDEIEMEVVEEVIFCPDCFDKGVWEKWKFIKGDILLDEDTRETSIYCRKHGRELDFSSFLLESGLV